MRALRAALFAAVCVTLAGAGHTSMSGHTLPLGALLAAFGVTLGIAWLAGARRRGVWSIGAVLVGVQGALHLIFSLAQPHGAAASHGSAQAQAQVHAHTPRHSTAMASHGGGHPAPPVADEPAFLDAASHGSTGMLAAHLLAAAVCALWLARGEAALFGLLRALRTLAFAPVRLLLAVVRVPSAPGRVRLPRPGRGGARPRTADLAHVVSRRGPPTVGVLPRYAPTAP